MSFPVNSTWGPRPNSSLRPPHHIKSDVNQRNPSSMQNNPVLTALPIYQPPQPQPQQSLQPQPQQSLQPHPFRPSHPHPHQQIGAPHNQIEMPRGSEDVLVFNPEHSAFSARTFVRWTPELERRFTGAVQELGGAFRATPKAVLKRMRVKGLTNKHINSHLQKVRAKSKSDWDAKLTAARKNFESALELSRGDADSNGGMNANGLQPFVQDIEAYGILLGNSEPPTFRQYLEIGRPSHTPSGTEDIDVECPTTNV